MEEQKFAEYMFKRVVDTVVEAGGPDKTYHTPKVNLAPQRSYTEQVQYTVLRQWYEIVTRDVPENLKGKVAMSRLPDDYERLVEFSQKLPNGVFAKYEMNNNEINLDERLEDTQAGTDLVARSILRAARYQMTGEQSSGYTTVARDFAMITRLMGSPQEGIVPAEVTEFFPAMAYVLSSEPTRVTMEGLLQDEEYFQGNVAVKMSEMIKAFERDEYDRCEELRERMSRSRAYMSLVADIPQPGVQKLMMVIDQGGSLDLVKKVTGTAFELKKKLSKEGGYDPRSLAELAVDRARPLLEEEWAKVMYMPGEEVDEVFIEPVRDELRDMKERKLMDRMRIKRAERKMRRMG